MQPKLYTIICSTRPGRKGPKMAEWFNEFAKKTGEFDAEVVDLADMKLPFLDEPHHPRAQNYQHEHTKNWSRKVSAADAFVFVVPEYNSAPPAEFSNALNYLFYEWNYKPAAILSYGGVSAGTRSAQVARSHISGMRMMPIPEGVNIPNFMQFFDEAGEFTANELIDASATTVLQELKRWHDGLKIVRQGD